MPFEFGGRTTPDDLMQRLAESNWQGAIVGRHGSGKSTLLATLLPAIEAAGRHAVIIRLHDGQRRLPLSRREIRRLGQRSMLLIDGYEQLSAWRRWRLPAQCREQGCGLLVTSHKLCTLPLLFRTEPELGLVERLIQCCLPPHQGRISRDDIARAWQRHAGNVREVFFELYDLLEARSCT